MSVLIFKLHTFWVLPGALSGCDIFVHVILPTCDFHFNSLLELFVLYEKYLMIFMVKKHPLPAHYYQR